jgi:hypothetical protein
MDGWVETQSLNYMSAIKRSKMSPRTRHSLVDTLFCRRMRVGTMDNLRDTRAADPQLCIDKLWQGFAVTLELCLASAEDDCLHKPNAFAQEPGSTTENVDEVRA